MSAVPAARRARMLAAACLGVWGCAHGAVSSDEPRTLPVDAASASQAPSELAPSSGDGASTFASAACSPQALAAVRAEAETSGAVGLARCASVGVLEVVVALDDVAPDVTHALLLRGGDVLTRLRVEAPAGFEAPEARCGSYLDLPEAPSVHSPLRPVPLEGGAPVVVAEVLHDVCGVACGTLLRERLYLAVIGTDLRLVLRADAAEHHYVVSNELAESYDCGEWDAELDVDEQAASIRTRRAGAPPVTHRWDGTGFTVDR